MPDSKITALTSISTSTDPANDPLVIVDLSDTSMAATGTTKKVTLNQLLGASGTATLASATISGDLTVDTSTLKVDSANNRVGVLTATPRAGFALDVLGNVALGDSTTTTSNRLKLDCSGTAGNVAIMSFAAAGTNKAFYGLSGGFLGDTSTDAMVATDAAGAAIRFFVSDTATEVARFNSTGNLAFANGKGIDFSATANGSGTMTSELLNDYEEGTFTPTIIGSTTAGTGTYVSQTGRYTKIGNQVTVWIYFYWTAHTGTGNMRVSGLPFNILNVSGFYPAASIGQLINISLTAGNVILAWGNLNSNQIVFTQSPTGGGADSEVPIDTSGGISLTMTYTV